MFRMLTKVISLFLVLFQISYHHCIGSELFSSMVGWEKLIDKEYQIVLFIQQYIDNRPTNELKRIHHHFLLRHSETKNQGQAFLGNPVNAFLLVKRLTIDWEYALNLTQKEVNFEPFFHVDHRNMPDDEDLTGAALAIIQLQDVYGMTANDICNADDCILLARVAHVQKKYDHCESWAMQALSMDDQWITVTKEQAINLLSICSYRKTLDIAGTQMESYDSNQYSDVSDATLEEFIEMDTFFEHDKKRFTLLAVGNAKTRDHAYMQYCSSSFYRNPDTSPIYKCYYKTNHPFLNLARIKVEIVRTQPRIVIFRDILSTYEVEVIKNLAVPLLKRAGVLYGGDSDSTISNDKLGKEAWLDSSDSHVIGDIQRRIELMTDFYVTNIKDDVFVTNYGIGGHFRPHHDLLGKPASEEAPGGERIGTVLFYMSAPEFGGHTVFPRLNLSVTPSMNDGIFWNNVHPDGTPDHRTVHTACPVLSGIKWITGSFVSEHAQTQCKLQI